MDVPEDINTLFAKVNAVRSFAQAAYVVILVHDVAFLSFKNFTGIVSSQIPKLLGVGSLNSVLSDEYTLSPNV